MYKNAHIPQTYLKAIYLLYHMIWFYLVQFFFLYLPIVNYGAFGSSLTFNLVRFMILFIFFLSENCLTCKKGAVHTKMLKSRVKPKSVTFRLKI